MKRFTVVSLLSILTTFAFAQKQTVDPSYSTHNYKHANKAAFASKRNLDKIVPLKATLVQGGGEYKHRHNQTLFVVKGSANTGKPAQYRRGYKHPLGL